MLRGLVVALALALLPAAAGADRGTARDLYERGTKAYNLQDFTRALDLFKQAYDQKPDPVLLFNIAQCQRQLGQYESASKSYRAFLNEFPNAPNRIEVRTQIKAMDDAAREARAKEPPTGIQPPSELEKEKQPPPPSPPPVVMVKRPWYKNTAGIALAATGIVLVAVGIGVAVQGELYRSDESTLPSLPERNAAADNAATFRPAGYALLGVGAGVLVAGAVVLAIGKKEPSRAAWKIAPSGSGLRVSW